MSKEKTCCFSGPRPHKLSYLKDEEGPRCVLLKKQLTDEILKKIMLYDCDTFLCGMARGVDMICAGLILELRRIMHSPLKLVCALPYLDQALHWEKKEQARYKEILSEADEKILVSREYTDSCIHARNRYMVERSAHLIAVYGGTGGGTEYTIRCAREKGLDVCVIEP